MTDKMDEICINSKFSAQEPYLWVILLYSSLESRMIPTIAVKLEFESIFQTV